jgi:hypothetical protein
MERRWTVCNVCECSMSTVVDIALDSVSVTHFFIVRNVFARCICEVCDVEILITEPVLN